jgi:hypothetical protein
MAPVMSIRCITEPPSMNPRGLESFGRTTCTVSVAESCQRLGAVMSVKRDDHGLLKIGDCRLRYSLEIERLQIARIIGRLGDWAIGRLGDWRLVIQLHVANRQWTITNPQ